MDGLTLGEPSTRQVPLRVAINVCARLCHDFAGPLGTLAGALELAPGDGGEAVALAGESAAALLARVRLMREAWGDGGCAQDAASVAALAAGLPGAERITLALGGLGELAPGLGQLVLCLLLVAAQGLPRGGVVTIAQPAPGRVRVRLSGRDAAWPALLAACARSEARAWDATADLRMLAVPLACLFAASAGYGVTVEDAETVELDPL